MMKRVINHEKKEALTFSGKGLFKEIISLSKAIF
jgi:hypothetical protein